MDPGRLRGPDELAAGAPDEGPGRRRLAWAAGMVVAGVALAVVRPDLTLHADRPAPRPAPPLPTAAPTLHGIRWPARGDLVGDEPFVAAAMARVRHERTDAARLYFAGTLPDGSRLVLAGTDVNRGIVATSVHALLVPQGTPVAVGRVSEAVALTDPQQVLAWAARGRDGAVQAVAMSRPGPLRFALSGRVEFGSDGIPRRVWTAEHAENGVVVTDLGSKAGPIVAVRADGPGVFTLPLVVRVMAWAPEPPVLLVSGVGADGY